MLERESEKELRRGVEGAIGGCGLPAAAGSFDFFDAGAEVESSSLLLG